MKTNFNYVKAVYSSFPYLLSFLALFLSPTFFRVLCPSLSDPVADVLITVLIIVVFVAVAIVVVLTLLPFTVVGAIVGLALLIVVVVWDFIALLPQPLESFLVNLDLAFLVAIIFFVALRVDFIPLLVYVVQVLSSSYLISDYLISLSARLYWKHTLTSS